MTSKKIENGINYIGISRRTALKAIGVGVVGGLGLSSKAAAQPPPNEPTWGSDGTDHWQLADANNPTPSDPESHRPLYGIAPAMGAHSPHGTHDIGPHDHVVDTPGSGKAFTANWHVSILFDSDGNLSNGGFSGADPPTISKIDDLVATDPDFILVPTDIEFTCPVRPHNPTDED